MVEVKTDCLLLVICVFLQSVTLHTEIFKNYVLTQGLVQFAQIGKISENFILDRLFLLLRCLNRSYLYIMVWLIGVGCTYIHAYTDFYN